MFTEYSFGDYFHGHYGFVVRLIVLEIKLVQGFLSPDMLGHFCKFFSGLYTLSYGFGDCGSSVIFVRIID